MLLDTNNTKIQITCQQYVCTEFRFQNNDTELWFEFDSHQDTKDVYCQYCDKNSVEIHDYFSTKLRDMPVFPGIRQYLRIRRHKYKCRVCNRVFAEDIPFKEPDVRVTKRAADFIREMLSLGLSSSSIARFTGVHWDTIRTIHSTIMEETLSKRFKYLKESGYRPKYLAVDEFAIHKGQTYATCVMDLNLGEVLWVGKGRNMEEFRHFFEEYDMDYLSEVEAVAMDMNASYNLLFKEYMPQVDIVYDRYHLQALFNTNVLSIVRVQEAKKHSETSKDMRKFWKDETEILLKKEWRQKYNDELDKYKSVKQSRWLLLTNKRNLSLVQQESLNTILEEHKQLAICYAMKEELNRLFEITDIHEAESRWKVWLKAARESCIKPLVTFAKTQEKNLEGLISHAAHPITTAKLEGLNNKIKVAKRVGYGFRNDDYFFTLVRYISIPFVYIQIPPKT